MSNHTDSERGGLDRRTFLAGVGAAAASTGTMGAERVHGKPPPTPRASPMFTISLAQWSLHRALHAGKLDHLDFPKAARHEFGIDAVEYVNSFFKEKHKPAYTRELKKRCDAEGVSSVLIMCDGEGHLGDPDEGKRTQAVENHHRWVEVARLLGCHSIRVNAHAEGTYQEQQKLAADGLRALTDFASVYEINVIVENHGGYSSDGAWLAGVMTLVGHPRCGTLPDFGNFNLGGGKQYDRYKGTEELMPFAKGVSAKSYDFDEKGNETTIDYRRMLKIVLAAGYHGRIGIEYEGGRMSETDGIKATKKLLETIRTESPTTAK
jgi:sugar phosphate isomerase/epimerase